MTNKERSSRLGAVCLSAALGTLAIFPLSHATAGESYGYGGGGGGNAAERELARRQGLLLDSQEDIAQGKRLYAEKDLEGAMGRFRSAIDRLPESPMTHDTRQEAVDLYAKVSVELAHERALEGRFDNAEQMLEAVLAPDIAPDDKAARRGLARLNDPDWYNRAMTPEHAANVTEVDRLLRLGKDYYDLGDFDNAEKQFNSVLRIDRTNSAARRGIEEVEFQRIAYHKTSRDQTRATMLRKVDELWESEVPALAIGGPGTGPGATSESTGRELITRKLNEIRVSVAFDETTVREALEFLHQKSVEGDTFDPARKGVDFILKSGGSSPAGESALPPGEVPITLTLQDVPLVSALGYITELANLKYKVETNAVVVVPQWDPGIDMFTQSFRVPPSFLTSSDSGGGGDAGAGDDPFAADAGAGGGGSGLKPKPTALEILTSQGVTFPEGASAIYQAGSSTLIVRNTQAQMELVEAYIDSLTSETPKQVLVTSKFVEVTQQNTDELGFDWLIGPFNVAGSDRVFAAGGTPGNALTNGVDSANYSFVPPGGGANPVPVGGNPVTAGLRSGGNAIESDAIDGLLNEVESPTSIAPAIFGVAGVFTDPQFQVMVRALKQQKGADLMSAPSVVTRSGQRAKIEIIREFIYPTEYDPPEIPQDFGSSNIGGGGFGGGGLPGLGGITPTSVNSFPVTPANPTAFEMRPVGVTLEVDPVIGPDGYMIELNIAPEVVEFEGFINYGSPIQSGAIDALGQPTTIVLTENRIEQPVFSSRKVSTAVTIWDGATVAIGGLIREDVQQTQDKVPFLGDIPLIGRLFRSNAESHFKRNLMIFVKAELIDPSGQRIHPPVATMAGAIPPAGGAGGSLFPEG